MLAHLAVTRDVNQHEAWKEQLDEIERVNAVTDASDDERRLILSNKKAWKLMRLAGRRGARWWSLPALGWTAALTGTYAFGHGFGVYALAFLLPVPFAWKLTRRMWERASLLGMRDLRNRSSLAHRSKAMLNSALRTFAAGFAGGFALVFIQGLLTWFMTPAPTLGLELFLDAQLASVAGVITGTLALPFAPMTARPAPPRSDALTETV